MRSRIRVAAFALLALSGVTCTDGPTSPSRGGGPALLRLAPSFSLGALQVFRDLAEFGLSVDNIHIHIDHPPAAPFDTVVTVPAGADSIALNLSVLLNSSTEQLNVQIELRHGSEVLYSGTQTVTSTVGATATSTPSDVPIKYVGPGATLVHFAIAPRDTAILVNGAVPFRITATDNTGAAVIGLGVHWTVADPTLGTVDSASSTFTPSGTAGTTRVIGATLAGLSDTATITISAPPSSVALVSGGGQTGAAGAALPQPVVVQVRSAGGAGVPGIVVAFASGTGGATPNPLTAVTDAGGNAQTTVTLGHTAGAQSVTATVPGLTPVTAAENATAAAAAQIAKVSGDAQSDTTKATLAQPFVVRVTDAFGNAVNGATVSWTRTAGAGALGAATSTTDNTGTASVGYALGATAGTDTITATLPGVSGASVAFTASASLPAAKIIVLVSGDRQIGLVGTTLSQPLVVRAVDAANHPISGTTIVWAAGIAGGTVNPATGVTDAQGQASTTFTLPATASFTNVTATLPNHAYVEFVEQAALPVTGSLHFVTQPSNVASATYIVPPIQVEVLDGSGRRDTAGTSANATIALGVLHGPTGGHVRDSLGYGGDTVQAVRGLATFHVGNDLIGTYKLIANAPGLKSDSSSSYVVSIGPAREVHVVAGNNQTGIAVDTTDTKPQVLVTDAGGNPVPGAQVTWTADSGGGTFVDPNAPTEPTSPLTTTADGTGHSSVFWWLGSTSLQTMHASVAGGSDTAHFVATINLPPSNLAFTNGFNDSYASGSHIPIVVQLLDENGDPVAQAGVPIGLYLENFGGGCSVGGQNHGLARATVHKGLAAAGSGARAAASARLHTMGCDVAPRRVPPGSLRGSLGARRRGAGARPGRQTRGAAVLFNAAPYGSGTWDTLPSIPDPTLVGDTVVLTDAQGRAVFSTLGVAGYAGEEFDIVAYDTASYSCVWSTYSPDLYLTPGAVYSVLAEYDSVHQAVSQHIVDFPVAIALDSVGNGVPGVNLALAATGGGTLDSNHVTTDDYGEAEITGWTLGGSSGVNTVVATGTTAGPHNAATLVAYAHQAGALFVETEPPETATDGAAFSTAIQVQVMDSTRTWCLNAGGVVITPSVVLYPADQDANAPSLAGNTSAVSSSPDGSAGFNGLGVSGDNGSTVVLVFTSPGLAPDTTSEVAIQVTGPAPDLSPLAVARSDASSSGVPIQRAGPARLLDSARPPALMVWAKAAPAPLQR